MKKLVSPTELRLLALVTEERTGREVAGLYEHETGRRISFGTLYTSLRRLRANGLVRMRDERDVDGRIRCFLATRHGLEALAATRLFHEDLALFGMKESATS